MSNLEANNIQPSSHTSEDVQTGMLRTWLPNIGEFIAKHTYKCFFIGTPLLIFGSYFYFTPMHNDMMYLVYTSLSLIFIGGILIWIPVFYWMTESTIESYSQVIEPAREPNPSPVVPRMKPPDYDSLTPLQPNFMPEAPPAYDEIFRNTELNNSGNNNEASANEGTISGLHPERSSSGIPSQLRDHHEIDTQPPLCLCLSSNEASASEGTSSTLHPERSSSGIPSQLREHHEIDTQPPLCVSMPKQAG